ncbi:MAG TPA: hypothetical protein VMT12_04530, partial [Syntrophales bacterium]|nr:hypothetical protein [Syntrophales bacterium]
MKRIIIFLCFSIILTSKFVHGKTFYVDNQLSSNCTGNYSIANRSCTGSDGNAYKTVAGGVAVLASGDTMYIRSGTYDENEIWIGANYASMVTLSGHQNERPILRNNGNISTGAKYYFHFNTTTNNLTFTKVEFTSTNGRTSTPSHDGAWAMNGWLTDDRNLIVVDNCYFHDMTLFIGGNPKYWIKNSRFITWGSEPFIASNALYLQGGTTGNRTSWSDAVIVENNYFETSKYGGNYIGCAIDVHHGDTGLNVSYHIIRYNIFKGEMFWATRVDGKYAKIYNNSADRVWVFFGTNYCQYVEIENNISSNTGAYYGFAYLEIGEQQAANMTIKNNMTTGVSSIYWTTCTNCTVSGNDCSGGSAGHCDYPSADPLYLSATPSTWTDFRLQSSSPAINAGLNLGTANQNGL